MKAQFWRRVAVGVAGGAVGYLGARAVRRTLAARAAGTGSGRRPHPPAVTVHRPPDEVYAFWRDLPTLARAVGHVARVEQVDERRSHWYVAGMGAAEVDVVVEIVRDEPPRLIEWRAGDGLLPHRGRVEFAPAPGRRGTEVRLHVTYPSGGPVPAEATGPADDRVEGLLYGALRRVKQAIEAGEIVVAAGGGARAEAPVATGRRSATGTGGRA